MISDYLNSENINKLFELVAPFLGRVVLGLVILFIGRIIIKRVEKLLTRYICNNIDKNIAPILARITSIGLNIVLVISVLSTIGVETTSFAALIGSAGVAFGFAMSGSLQNIASALIILTFKPFEVGDVIEINDVEGEVKAIKIFNTAVQQFDKSYAFVPNNILTTNEVINYSRDGVRRGEINIGIGYSSDIKKAKEVILATVSKMDFVLTDPQPQLGVSELGDSSVNLKLFVYVNKEDYINVVLNVYEPLKVALEKAGIELPFPQLDVHKV